MCDVQNVNLRTRVLPWRQPSAVLAAWQVLSTLFAVGAAWFATHCLWRFQPWLALLTVPVHSGLMMRLFVLQHDCSHHSLFPSKRMNDLVGFWLGAMFLTPHLEWRRSHAIHHATSSSLERRNPGDIYTMTVDEYLAAPLWRRLAYRLVRHPLIMLGVGPIYVFIFKQRLKGSLCPGLPRGRRFVAVQCTTLAAVFLGFAGCSILGTREFLTIWALSFWLAGAIGVYLFYMQHNFEFAYYAHDRAEYSFERAAMAGSSYLDLPAWGHWCTANVGYHHIHHLDPLIPNYRLAACHEAVFRDAPLARFTLWDVWTCSRYKLYDRDQRKLITWRELNRKATSLRCCPVVQPVSSKHSFADEGGD